MGQILSFWRARFVIIPSKSVLSQTQTTTNEHPARKIGQITTLITFSFPCFKVSHPHKTYYNIIMMPLHNSCQEPTNLLTPPLKKSHCKAKFPSVSLGLCRASTQLAAYELRHSSSTSVKDACCVQGTGQVLGVESKSCPHRTYFLWKETHSKHLMT